MTWEIQQLRELILKNLAENDCLKPGIFLLEFNQTAWHVLCFPFDGFLTVVATDLAEDETYEFEARGPMFVV